MKAPNKNTQKILATLAFLSAVGVGLRQVQGALSEHHLNNLLVASSREDRHSDDSAKDPARKQRAWRLYSLWMARDRQNVAPQLIPYLDDEYIQIRLSAARMLGRLESPKGLLPLQKTQARANQNQVDPITVKLALGRIGAHNLKGKAKFAALAKSVGLSLDEADRLTAKYVAAWSRANGSSSETITREFVELLYSMGKQKQDITAIAQRLTLYPAQRLQLQASHVSSRQEVELILSYLVQLDVVTPRDGELTNHMMRVGPIANHLLVARLARDAQQGRPIKHSGYSELLRAAALSNDPRVPDLLQKFCSNPNSDVAGYAHVTRMMAQHRADLASPLSPYPPLP